MKKIITLLIFILGFLFNSNAQVGMCPCPEHFFVRDSVNCNNVMLDPGSAPGLNFSNSDSTLLRACQFSTMKYCLQIEGSDPNCKYENFHIDTVLVVGGTLVSNTNFCYTINWGGSNTGTVQIQYSIPGGSTGNPCNGTLTIHYKLLPNPIAAFTIAPNPACFNNPTNITFNSSTSVGALSYFWNFGDGFTSTAANPVHAYTNPGTYTVCLTVTNAPPSYGGTALQGPCPTCSDSVCQTVVINNLPGPDIDDCVATVCAGETGTYCTTAICALYNWVVTGGVIISANPSTSNCITVLWGSGNPQGNVHLDVPGCPGFCSQGTDVTIPIIPASTNITGSNVVCLGTTSAYSLPAWPGTTYNWSISGGQLINGNNTNTTSINTTWNMLGTYTITCVYFDTALNCGGTGTIVVNVLAEMQISGPKVRCVGQTSTLHSFNSITNANVNCTWNISPSGATITGGNGSSFLNVQWDTAGTYVVTATPTTANQVCGPVSYTVIVFPQPIISAINGLDSICSGDTVVYSATSNMAGLFNWVITGGTSTCLGANCDSVQIAWNASAPYYINVSQTSYANNCPSNVLADTVFAYPTPNVSGSITVCADDTVTYTITNIGANNFNWHITPAQFGTVVSTTGSSVQIKWHGNNNPGVNNIVYLHYGNCNDDSIAITISEPIAPTITSAGSLCVGSGITLTASGAGTFSWSALQIPAYSSVTNTLASINDPGHYQVQLTTAAGCVVTATHHIPSVGFPVAQISATGSITYCAPSNMNTVLNAVTGGGYTYQWYLGGSPISGATNSSYNVTGASAVATYLYHCVVMLNGCSKVSNTVVINGITCPIGGGGTGVGCSGAIAISSITGCNPFVVTPIVTVGQFIIPGTQKIQHFEDGLILNGNTTRNYTSVGQKSIRVCVDVKLLNGDTCRVCKDTFVTVPLAANFLTNVNCGIITLTDLSLAASTYTITGYSWSVTPSGTFNFNNIPSPVLTVTNSGTYIISQTVTASNGCTSTFLDTVIISLPDADFNVNPNSCVGTTINLNNLFPAFINYWNFGDATSSNTSPTFHAYASTGLFFIKHTVTDLYGCKDSVSKPITIIAAPICTITITGDTIFCLGDSVKLSACAGYASYQWKNNGVNISGATSQIYYAKQTGNYSFVGIDPNGCDVTSNTVTVTVNQTASTSMTFTGKKCFGEFYSVSVPTCVGCLYQWEVDGNVVLPFGTTNSYSQTVGTAPFLLGSHLIKVTILALNGCISMDSINVIFNPQPTISCTVLGNPALLCSNNNYTFNATSNATSPAWAWTLTGFNNILSTTSSLVASAAGTYNVLVTDGITGCTNSASHFINESPNLSLFPIGCDTLCQNTKLFLPLASFNGDVSCYSITWYDNAPPYIAPNIVGTGIFLNLNTLALGSHNISVIVVSLCNGCVDTSNVYSIFIVPATSTVTNTTACGSYLWTVNNVTYTATGVYTFSSLNANGCPHYDTLNLTITTAFGTSTTVSSCVPYTWSVSGLTYTVSGVYTFTSMVGTCLKTDTLILNIGIASGTSLTIIACNQYLWTVNGVTYTVSGTYFATSIDPLGCQHSDTLILTINHDIDTITNATACASYTWPSNGVTYTASGTYTFTTAIAGGCIKYHILNLIINNTGITTSTTASSCVPYTWVVNGVTYTASGIYTHTTVGTDGCISTHTLHLIINEACSYTYNVNICDIYTWAVNGITYTASGVYTHTVLNANGCVCTYTLHLTINYSTIITTYVTACDSFYWNINGVTYTISCVQTHIVYTDSCPTIYVLCLTIVPSTSSHDTVTKCDTFTWLVNGVTYTASGIYTHSSLNAFGCTHTSTLHLIILPSTSSTVNVTACNSYTWLLNGVTYTASGTYTFTSINQEGCPHITTLHLIITNGTSSTLNVIACDAYTWFGITYTASGNYTHTSVNSAGCIHTVTLHLTINYSSITTVFVTACGTYTWVVNGVTYTTSGTYTSITVGANGCPKINVLCLTICHNTESIITVSACNSYTWAANGLTYTASGTYTKTSINACGCVHTSTLVLTINHGTVSTITINACNFYTWSANGVTYTNSGTYSFTSLNAQGCLSSATLILTIHHGVTTNTTIMACNEYHWNVNGVTYTASGVYTYTSLNANGCVNSHTLNLTIHHSTSSSISATACDSYTWLANGITYTTSGTYINTFLNTEGCPHTATLILTINYSTSSSVTVIGCEAYTWIVNGTTYTASGTYTSTSTNANGCPHTDTLILTIGNTTITHIFDTACCEYTWTLNGVTYTQSGIYTIFTLGQNGCPHIIILCVTIYPCINTSSTVIACGSYTWNGITYTASGTYTRTLLNSYGCPITDTLHVTIGTNVVTTSICDTVCDHYFWNVNGVTYTMSGLYTYITYDSNGCPHIYILCITIHHHTDAVVSATATGSYLWSANNTTYTVSGAYTTTLVNSQLCDSILTLQLTIIPPIPPISITLAPKAMLSGPYQPSTGLMNDVLRTQSLIPLAEPYSGAPFFKLQLLGGGGETTTASVLNVTGNNAIVDWVHLEIRSGINCSSIIATKNALLQRDGDIVSTDGFSPLSFPLLPSGNYCVSIKHRNHLGVMTATTMPLTSGLYALDFTNIPLYTNTAITNNGPANFTGSINLLWSGDPNYNRNVKYNGSINDKDPILNVVGIGTPNNVIFGYRREDVNMDGQIKYNNTDNDRVIILGNVGSTTPNKVLFQHTPN